MPAEQIVQIVPGLYATLLGIVNAFFIDDSDGSILIDTGSPGNADKILSALQGLSEPPHIRYIRTIVSFKAECKGSALMPLRMNESF